MTEKRIPISVSPNMKRETIFLNAKGDRIDNLRNRRVISKAEVEEQPPAPAPEEQPAPQSNALSSIIEQKVQEAVVKSISSIDIGKMVEDAISKSFGGK